MGESNDKRGLSIDGDRLDPGKTHFSIEAEELARARERIAELEAGIEASGRGYVTMMQQRDSARKEVARLRGRDVELRRIASELRGMKDSARKPARNSTLERFATRIELLLPSAEAGEDNDAH